MEISIINIGNSKGLILSQTVLKKYNLKDKVDIILENEQIVIKPIKEPRKGWGKSFEEMANKGDDELLIPDIFEDEEIEEW
jgi:antitoxin MazE